MDEKVVDEELQTAESLGSKHNLWGLVVLGVVVVVLGVVGCFLLGFLAACFCGVCWFRFKGNLERGKGMEEQEEGLQVEVVQAVQEK